MGKRALIVLLSLWTAVFLSGCREETVPLETTQTVQSTVSTQNTQPLEESWLTLTDTVPEYDTQSGNSFQVPGMSDEASPPEAGYFHIGSYGHYENSNDLFRICTDGQEMNQGSHFSVYQMVDNQMKELPRYYFLEDFEVLGNSFRVEFEYVRYGDGLIITYIPANTWEYRLLDLELGESKCLISFDCGLDNGDRMDYPMLLDVKNGVLMDILGESDADTWPTAQHADPGSSNVYGIKDAVFLQNQCLLMRMNGGAHYYFDAPTGKVYNLNELSGRQVADCAVADGGIICWNEIDDYWRIDLNTLEATEVLMDVAYVEYVCGIWNGAGASFTLYRDQDWQLHVFDFLTGEDCILQEPAGWTVEGYQCHPSPDGRKFFMLNANDQGTYQLLIFDCDRKQFILLNRNNPNPVKEGLCSWTRDNAIVITSDTYQDFYVYKWKEQETEVIEKAETSAPQDGDFVLVKDYIPDLQVEMKYAAADNFTGHVIYEFQEAYLRYGTVKKLVEVQKELNAMGLGLKLWDGFRPVAAQFKLWEIFPNSTYVANPTKGFSSHSRGNTVDITIVETATGAEIEMPTEFDDFSGLADRDYSDCPETAAKNALLLEGIMERHGFTGYFGEWWHFADTVRYEVEHCFDPSLISQWQADCEAYISLRQAPELAAGVLDRIPVGETFTLLGYDGDFALVDYRGIRGYVLSAYMKPV